MDYLSGKYAGKRNKKFSEEVRKFVLTVRFYSPRAYDYLREKFNNTIPHPGTIQRWYRKSEVQTQSGICTRNFQLLKDKVDELKKEGKELWAGMVFDEMNIRQHLEWLKEKKFSGFITFGKVSDDDEMLPLAKQVLVFMLSGINVKFQMPIAYFFISSIDGIDKVILITSIIKMIHATGVKLVTMTYDGHSTNIAASEMLGCSYKLDDLRPHFTNPENDSQIYTFLDPPHMIKCIRNSLGSRKTFYDRVGRKIEWKYIVHLVELKDMLTHKLTIAHINYESKYKMKAILAIQVFSSSTANSIKSLIDRKYPGFEDAAATAEFCLRINQCFDILNSDVYRSDNVYKSPVTEQTFPEIFSFIDDMIHYMTNLTLQPFKNPIVDSEIKVGFKGMVIGLKNVKLIFSNFVQNNLLDQFPVRNICQCPLESFFSRCRSYSMLGNNTNPTINQFEALIRKVLVKNEITSSVFANCSDQLNILHVSSHVPKTLNNNSRNIESANECPALQIPSNDSDPEHDFHLENPSNEQMGIAFLSGEIDNRIQFNGVLHCHLCSSAISENAKLSIDAFPETKFVKIPCKSTYEICAMTHRILEPLIMTSNFDFHETVSKIITEIHPSSLFASTNFSDHSNSNDNHKDSFIKYIIETYISMRATHIAKQKTLECQENRQKGKKISHFQGR